MSFFSIPATGKRKAAAKSAFGTMDNAEAPPPAPPPKPPPPPPPPQFLVEEEEEEAAEPEPAGEYFPYPSMRSTYDADVADLREAGRAAAIEAAKPVDRSRPTSVFVSGLADDFRDSQLSGLFNNAGAGVVREVHRVRHKTSKKLTGCAIVTFGTVGAGVEGKPSGFLVPVASSVERDGFWSNFELKNLTESPRRAFLNTGTNDAVSVKRSERRAKDRGEKGEDGSGGARFDALNNRMYPHEVPEVQLDYKKRKIAYPRDHNAPP